jgi:hydrogenase nickel incorporation protein HypA/HybF
MHELAVTESILEIALRHAREAGAGRIVDVRLVIGQWSSIVDDSVQFYWDIVSQGTPAEGARLHFRRVPIQLECLACRHPYAPAGDDLACPVCGDSRFKVIAGEEFYLEAIDVESDATSPIVAQENPA